MTTKKRGAGGQDLVVRPADIQHGQGYAGARTVFFDLCNKEGKPIEQGVQFIQGCACFYLHMEMQVPHASGQKDVGIMAIGPAHGGNADATIVLPGMVNH